MPTYEHLCDNCKHEWEEIYGMTEPIPTTCPECKIGGKVQRLISGGSGRGIVQLTGHELRSYVQSEAASWKKAAVKDEKMLANLVGEDKYQRNTVQREKLSASRPKIKTRKKSA